ncbi:MAG: Eco57I restriction-modification methylase domain-containing protein [Fusobacteriaceae bacterium]|jgi:adenine-specific DNA-methyltransferase|nr:Eco57I restriction-modification methylase domain-containing protein [Fusobacteriaceae bacterium]MBP6468582.1 Eco57I restriction-modification methylase domain-containing protein [Fusobacteriaceae bacterium]
MNILASRFQNIHEDKKNGVTYTPVELAEFVAKKAISYLDSSDFSNKKIRVLDPSIGDGILISELLRNLEVSKFSEVEIVGVDLDDSHFEEIKTSIQNEYPNVKLILLKNDFLDFYDSNKENYFDIIIANPPYIRTQIIGSEKSQKISKEFDLKGKTDIYYAFMMVIAKLLSHNGVSATITSNRFLSIKSGKVLRDFLLDTLDIQSIYDLGDTKVFTSAAVLPALVFSKKKNKESGGNPEFTTIYEVKKSKQDHKWVGSIFSELEGSSKYIKVGKVNFEIVKGVLNLSKSRNNVWAVGTEINDTWLSKVAENTWKTFKDVGPIRVGVKSTADKVFIRDDWDKFELKPELLRYLLTSDCAQQFKAVAPKKPKEIIYPHTSNEKGKKQAIDLNDYPFTKKYLEEYKEKLSSREYLMKAGRNWYELWVPQDPSLWCKPKIVFPDISEKPKFWMDLDENIVNGECYWITPNNTEDNELLWLCLAVANSKFIEMFYDYKFNNKLYSGKRRFMKQYVEEFPIPDPSLDNSKELIELSKNIYQETNLEKEQNLKDKLDQLVFKAFQLN